MLKKIFYISLWIALIAGVFTTLGFISVEQEEMVCSKLNINIDHKDESYFVNKADIEQLVAGNGKNILGRPMQSIDIPRLEKLINNHPAIARAEVFKTINGEVNIEVTQRKPLFRVFNSYNESYYIDEEGYFMPLSPNYTARVPAASGNIISRYVSVAGFNISDIEKDSALAARSLLDDLFRLAKYINSDPFWKAQVQQIYVNGEKELELIPVVGNHRIIFGDVKDLEEKFSKLMIFYRYGLSKTGWNDYSEINLKYKNQIVCSKN